MRADEIGMVENAKEVHGSLRVGGVNPKVCGGTIR